MLGSGSDEFLKKRDTNSNPATDPPASQGFEEVLSLFKTFRLEQKEKELEDKQKLTIGREVQIQK